MTSLKSQYLHNVTFWHRPLERSKLALGGVGETEQGMPSLPMVIQLQEQEEQPFSFTTPHTSAGSSDRPQQTSNNGVDSKVEVDHQVKVKPHEFETRTRDAANQELIKLDNNMALNLNVSLRGRQR